MNDDAMMREGLRVMGMALEAELEPGTAFALFVEWRDGKPPSYLSNANRADVITELARWSGKLHAAMAAGAVFVPGPPPASKPVGPLEAKCAELGKQMAEEDIDVVLFLFTNGEGGETVWFSSWRDMTGFQLVDAWIADERRKS